MGAICENDGTLFPKIIVLGGGGGGRGGNSLKSAGKFSKK